ncbi:MAG: SLC13 family permease [Phycisphaerales bacterium]|nr:SLC13 family permease [Phycisphaerales bacterium]
MGFDAWFTLACIVLALVGMASGRVSADLGMLGALVVLMLAGVLPVYEALAGFAHPSVIMVGALFVLAGGLVETGAMQMILAPLLGRPRGPHTALLRLTGPVAVLSAFMNNTPIVAAYLPAVMEWSRRTARPAAQLLMPLSFAALLGGMVTLIGTATNVAITEMYVSYVEHAPEAAAMQLEAPTPARQFWWITPVGLPAAMTGMLVMWFLAPRALKERSAAPGMREEARKYTVAMTVRADSSIVGRTIEAAGLRHLPGAYLAELERNGVALPAVSPRTVLEANDVLVFVGVVESVVDLRKTRGLEPATDQVTKLNMENRERRLVEAVVSARSPLVRRNVRESRFRTRYDAAVIAVHRGGERVPGKIGDIVLQAGDTLLLETHDGFLTAYRNSDEFYLLSTVADADLPRFERAGVAITIVVLFVLLMTLPIPLIVRAMGNLFGDSWNIKDISPVVAALVCALLMVATRSCPAARAKTRIDWTVLITIAAALGVGRALTVSGAADAIASGTLQAIQGLGSIGGLAMIFVVTCLLTQVITNASAAVLMFPIAIAAAEHMQNSPEPYVIALMIAASCAFLSPFGYQTNLMVYGPGRYKPLDFMRLGVPITVCVGAVTIVLCALMYA